MQALKPLSEMQPVDRAYARNKLSYPVSYLQRLRQARYMATIETGKGAGMVCRKALTECRADMLLTSEHARKMHAKITALYAEAEMNGFDPQEVVGQARRDAIASEQARWSGIITMLSRGGGYYPGPRERIEAKRSRANS